MNANDYQNELNIIKNIAVNNNFDMCLIEKVIKKKKQNLNLRLVYPYQRENNKYSSLTYIGDISDILNNKLKKLDINVGFKTENKLSRFIKNNKDKKDKKANSGIYRLNCGSCSKFYIGQTGRSFKVRIHEHRASFINNKVEHSNYAKHLVNENHNFDENFKILHIENKGQKLNNLEIMEINKYKHNDLLLNDQVELSNSPLLNIFSG